MAAKKTQDDFIRLLRSDRLPAEKQEMSIQSRIIALGHGTYCGRCGGGGNYSFNMVNGTTCFGCSGSGYTKAKLTDKLYAALEVEIAAGKLDAYLEDLTRRHEINRKCKGAMDKTMKAWTGTGVANSYKWQLAAQGVEPHKTIATEFNKPMCDAYESVSKASIDLNSAQILRRKVTTADERVAADERVDKAAIKLVETTEAALATIEERALAFKAFMDAQPKKKPDYDSPSP
ncbi:hypothetical protein ACYPKM_04465 [Pseudomonas aeruginosa]